MQNLNRILVQYRDKESRVAIINIAGSLIIKGISLVISMYMLTAYLTYFKDETFLGVWLTIVSILNWILTFDLGIGNGLRNHLTKAIAKRNQIEICEYISSAYYSLFAMSLIGFLCGCGIAFGVDWGSVLNVSSHVISAHNLRLVMLINCITVFSRLFLNVITSILYTLQKTMVTNLLYLVTNILLVVYLLTCKLDSDTYGLLQLTYAYLFLANMPLLVATIIIFLTSLKNNYPRIRMVKYAAVRDVLTLGGCFFVAQIEMMLLNATNEFIINSLYGPVCVVEYQIYYKIFSVAAIVFSIICQPVWSAITKAVCEREFERVNRFSQMMYIVAILGTLSCVVAALMLQPIVDTWVGKEQITVQYRIALAFVLYMGTTMLTNAATCVANGLGKVYTQIIYLFVAIVIKYIGVYGIHNFGISDWCSIIWINGILLAGMAIVQMIINKKNLLKYSIRDNNI